MHANKHTIGLNKVPFNVPVNALMHGFYYVNLDITDYMMRTGLIAIASDPTDDIAHIP